MIEHCFVIIFREANFSKKKLEFLWYVFKKTFSSAGSKKCMIFGIKMILRIAPWWGINLSSPRGEIERSDNMNLSNHELNEKSSCPWAYGKFEGVGKFIPNERLRIRCLTLKNYCKLGLRGLQLSVAAFDDVSKVRAHLSGSKASSFIGGVSEELRINDLHFARSAMSLVKRTIVDAPRFVLEGAFHAEATSFSISLLCSYAPWSGFQSVRSDEISISSLGKVAQLRETRSLSSVMAFVVRQAHRTCVLQRWWSPDKCVASFRTENLSISVKLLMTFVHRIIASLSTRSSTHADMPMCLWICEHVQDLHDISQKCASSENFFLCSIDTNVKIKLTEDLPVQTY